MAYSLLHLIVRLLAFSGGQHQHVQTSSPWVPPALLQQLQQHQPYPPWLDMPSSAEPTSWLSETTSVPKSGREFNNRRILKDGGTSVAEPSTGIWTLGTSSLVATSPLFGGPHGRSFDDSEVVGMFGRTISKVVLHGSKERLTGISFIYSDNLKRLHGTDGKSSLELEVSKENPITKMSFVKCKKGRPGRKHTRVCGATFATKVKEVSLGKESGKTPDPNEQTLDVPGKLSLGKESGKTPDPNEQTLDVPEKFEVIGMSGRDGQRLDQASIIAINRDKISSMPPAPNTGYWTQLPLVPGISYSNPVGGNGGRNEFDSLTSINSDIMEVRVTKISLYGTKSLRGIKLEYNNGNVFPIGKLFEHEEQLELGEDEHVTKFVFKVWTDRRYLHRVPVIGSASVFTNKGVEISSYFQDRFLTSVDERTIVIPEGTEFKGLSGKAGRGIDQLSVIIASTSAAALPPN